MNPFSEEYFKRELNFFNNRIKTFKKNEKGNFRYEFKKDNFLTALGQDWNEIKYHDKIFNRLDGYMYTDYREWTNFPVLKEFNLFDPIIWMSMTPMEISSQFSAIQMAKGHVGVGGVGLGYYLQRILEKDVVNKVTVFEINHNIIDLYKMNFGIHEKLKIVHDDLLSQKNYEFDFFYNDIYKEIYGENIFEDMIKLTSLNNIETYTFWGFDSILVNILFDDEDISYFPEEWKKAGKKIYEYLFASEKAGSFVHYRDKSLYNKLKNFFKERTVKINE